MEDANKPDILKKIIADYFFIQWHITSKCNLACIHCYGAYGKRESNELSTQECKKFIMKYNEWMKEWKLKGAIHLTGGEPLLRDDLFEILNFIKKYRLNIRLLSNATLIDEKIARKIAESGIDSVSVGFDEPTAFCFNRFRGRKDAFNYAINGIRNLKKYGVKVTIGPTLNRQNIKHLPDLLKLSDSLGVDVFRVHRLVPLGKGEKLKKSMLSKKELMNVYRLLIKYSKKMHNTKISTTGVLWPILNKNVELGGCVIGFSGLAILSEGTILPCRLMPIPLGNIRKDSIKDIYLNNELLRTMRARMLSGKCAKCVYRWSCGGCRAVSYAVNGDPFGEDPQCWFKKK